MAKEAEKQQEDWMTTKWRPMMAVTYMATIWFDFVIGPIIFNILQYWNLGQAVTSWTPLTLQGGGLYHISMGAILGIAAWTRGKEKIATIENGGKDFNGGYEGAPVASPSMEPQWINTPAPTQGYTPQQTWAQPEAPVQERSQPVVHVNIGSDEPDFNEFASPAPDVSVSVNTDPDRPLRRQRK